MPKNKREGGSETMPLFYSDDCGELYCGDSLAILRELPDGAADAVVTDPPYSSGASCALTECPRQMRNINQAGQKNSIQLL